MTGTNLPITTNHLWFGVAQRNENRTIGVRVHYAVSDTTQPATCVVGLVCGCVGGDSSRETPGPFPNPEAKPGYADGTALGRVWESRLPPTKNLK